MVSEERRHCCLKNSNIVRIPNMCVKGTVFATEAETVGLCTVASAFRHTLYLLITGKIAVLKRTILQIVLARKPERTQTKHGFLIQFELYPWILLFFFLSFFANQPSFNPRPLCFFSSHLTASPSLSFCYLGSVLKETHCYIRAKQVETEIPLSAVEGWLAISQPWLQR